MLQGSTETLLAKRTDYGIGKLRRNGT